MSARILLIDDNQQNRYLVRFLLEHRGHEVISAERGEEGVALALKRLPQLILLDIQLPGMDGYAVARQLRSYDAVREVPIVAVTSCAMVGDREAVFAAGCAGYIEKPIEPETFAETIEAFLPPRARPAP
ncbi:MAG: response regulator [Vicinamibacterales bacterium]